MRIARLLDERQRHRVEDDLDDQALAERARFDREAFGALYDRHVARVYGFCRRRLESQEEAEDATSLVFTRALAAMPSWRPGEASFATWLFAIARNVVIDQSRTAARRRRLHGFPDVDASQSPEESAEAHEAAAELRSVLSQLPPEQAEIVDLRLSGLNDREIAAILGKSYGAVRVAQHRAIKRLRVLLDKRGKD